MNQNSNSAHPPSAGKSAGAARTSARVTRCGVDALVRRAETRLGAWRSFTAPEADSKEQSLA